MRYILLFLLLPFSLQAQISLPKLVSDGAVLQRDQPLKIWGYASPGEKITITFDKKKYRTKADQNGNWTTTLPANQAGGPYEMILKGKNEIRVKDLLFGDVLALYRAIQYGYPDGKSKGKIPRRYCQRQLS
ncbi:MAG: hypothetical protein R3B93_19305 [Bacteroidia bacterium]